MDEEINKQAKLRILFALMELGGKKDKEIAKNLGINNSTLSRGRKKLEQEGYIKEYALIPDFHKIGLEFIVFSYSTTLDIVSPIQLKEAHDLVAKYPEVLCLLEDQGGSTGSSWVAVTIAKNYADFAELTRKVQKELLSLHPMPRVETHSFMFRTGKGFRKQFSMRYLRYLFQSTKSC